MPCERFVWLKHITYMSLVWSDLIWQLSSVERINLRLITFLFIGDLCFEINTPVSLTAYQSSVLVVVSFVERKFREVVIN